MDDRRQGAELNHRVETASVVHRCARVDDCRGEGRRVIALFDASRLHLQERVDDAAPRDGVGIGATGADEVDPTADAGEARRTGQVEGGRTRPVFELLEDQLLGPLAFRGPPDVGVPFAAGKPLGKAAQRREKQGRSLSTEKKIRPINGTAQPTGEILAAV